MEYNYTYFLDENSYKIQIRQQNVQIDWSTGNPISTEIALDTSNYVICIIDWSNLVTFLQSIQR